MRTWWPRLALTAAALAVAHVAMGIRGAATVPATLAVVAVVLALLDAVRPDPSGWSMPAEDRDPAAAEDHSIAALRRLIEDNRSSRSPDQHLQQRLAALVRERQHPSAPLPPTLQSLLADPTPRRFGNRQLDRIIKEIEQL